MRILQINNYLTDDIDYMLGFKKYISITFIVLLVLLVGCEKKEPVADYKTEAKALCEVFNPQKWENMPKDLTPIEIQQIFSDGIQSAVHSEKMKEIVHTIPKIPAELRYKYIVESISALTGEPYSCPGLEEYFSA